MSKMKEIPEVKSLRWLANMFPYTENPEDDSDRMSNAIHIYCTAGADKIEEYASLLEVANNQLKDNKNRVED